MVRLTVDLVNNSLSYINPLKERELDLRGNKIPAIENLGVATAYDALDLTENSLTTLSNLPLLPRLTTLLLSRNRISQIAPTLARNLPNLSTVNLSGNRLTELSDVDALAPCARLAHLVLADNPLVKRQHYRAWVIWRIPSLRYLDYAKVGQGEREQALELFGAAGADAGMSGLARKIAGTKSKAFDVGAGVNGVDAADGHGVDGIARMKFSDEEKRRIRVMLENAKSDAELDRLQKLISQGHVPDEVMGGM